MNLNYKKLSKIPIYLYEKLPDEPFKEVFV
nr:MAG TPA: hypothetical protein [Caudoviricetes sp.]